MNDRVRRLREEEEQRQKQRKRMNRTSFSGILLCVVVAFTVSGLSGGKKEAEPAKTAEPSGLQSSELEIYPKSTPSPKPSQQLPWELLVVSKAQRLPEDFSVELQKIESEEVDGRIFKPLKEMIAAAGAEGVSLQICSGYRSREAQEKLYSDKVKEWMKQGLGEEASVLEAGKYLLPSGASEHHTGLAVDFLTEGYGVLDSGFAKTKAYSWLAEHAGEYGFIERYPKGMEGETGLNWEPWHYRYVGVQYAADIKAAGQTLEAYTADFIAMKQEELIAQAE